MARHVRRTWDMVKMIKKEATKKPTLAILDADLFIFQAAYSNRDQMNMIGLMAAKNKLDSLIQAVLEKVNCDHYLGFYGEPGTKNYRYDIATLKPYKDSRGKREEPWIDYFKPLLKHYMGEHWGFIPVANIEADDAVSIAYYQYKDSHDITMIFEDKDLKQIAYFADTDLKRYNPNRKHGANRIEAITINEGMETFYWQALWGDPGDAIVGIEGVGKEGAQKMIDKIKLTIENPTENDYFQMVQDQYIKKYKNAYLPIMLENFALLKMLQKPMFDYPKDIELKKFERVTTKTKILNI